MRWTKSKVKSAEVVSTHSIGRDTESVTEAVL